ncbi:hypothetical protein AB0M36_34865 [Actinoplanes sp. NPDC051346]|uniref:hypothetical protein n=1 Tax=Actinoplanes sp. NPDC051346 TaxID=3155048 RepID=UPI003425E136
MNPQDPHTGQQQPYPPPYPGPMHMTAEEQARLAGHQNRLLNQAGNQFVWGRRVLKAMAVLFAGIAVVSLVAAVVVALLPNGSPMYALVAASCGCPMAGVAALTWWAGNSFRAHQDAVATMADITHRQSQPPDPR